MGLRVCLALVDRADELPKPGPANSLSTLALSSNSQAGSLIGPDGKWKLPPGAPSPAIAPFDETKAKEHQAGWAKQLGVPVEITNAVGMKLMLIPPGEFDMGSSESDTAAAYNEKPQHHVRITRPFYLGTYAVTQQQWVAVMDSNPSNYKGPNNPVVEVNWEHCQVFLDKLNAKTAGQGGKFVMPTDAQWEYACRAGTTTKYCFGDYETQLGDYAWYKANAEDKTHPVGEKKPNAWGLYDMHGNACGWCKDWYEDYYYLISPMDDPAGPLGGTLHVYRGGSWANSGQRLPIRECAGARNPGSTRTSVCVSPWSCPTRRPNGRS